MFRALGLDGARRARRSGTPSAIWSRPASTSIIKPNLVSSKNLHEKITGEKLAGLEHARLPAPPVLDYALRAVGPRGRVRVVDTPVEGCEIEKVAGPLGIFAVIDHLRAKAATSSSSTCGTSGWRRTWPSTTCAAGGRSFNLGLLLLRTRCPGIRAATGWWIRRRAASSSRRAAGRHLRFHRSHYETPVRAPHQRPPRVLGAGHGARRRRGDQPAQDEDAQEDRR